MPPFKGSYPAFIACITIRSTMSRIARGILNWPGAGGMVVARALRLHRCQSTPLDHSSLLLAE